MAAKVVARRPRDASAQPGSPRRRTTSAQPKKGSRASPLAVGIGRAYDEIEDLIKRVRRGTWFVLGGSPRRAMLALQPPKARPTPEPTAVYDVDIAALDEEFDDVCEEVRTSGVTYRVLVRGAHAAWLCPTTLAWTTKIARTRANLAQPLIEDLRSEVRRLAQRFDEFEDRMEPRDEKMQRILGVAEQWLREWRQAQGLPPELPPEPTD